MCLATLTARNGTLRLPDLAPGQHRESCRMARPPLIKKED
jgi:hypothetical protein